MKQVINDPNIKSYRPNVSEWVELVAITRDQLCSQTKIGRAHV